MRRECRLPPGADKRTIESRQGGGDVDRSPLAEIGKNCVRTALQPLQPSSSGRLQQLGCRSSKQASTILKLLVPT